MKDKNKKKFEEGISDLTTAQNVDVVAAAAWRANDDSASAPNMTSAIESESKATVSGKMQRLSDEKKENLKVCIRVFLWCLDVGPVGNNSK